MTVVGWLADAGNADGTLGGAELTEREFARHAPDGFEIRRMAPGEVGPADVYVVHNCVTYPAAETIGALAGAPAVKYVHDAWPHGDPDLKSWLLENAQCIFTGPAHALMFDRARIGRAGGRPCPAADVWIPPAIDLAPFHQARVLAGDRADACWVGHFQWHGKGINLACEWAEQSGTVLHFYGDGPLAPRETGHVRVHGPVDPGDVPEVMARHRQFVHLPSGREPFGRSVVEAWTAGCSLVVNGNVGAAWWIENDPDALDGAADRFWQAVERGMR